jgi:hypothetical protein
MGHGARRVEGHRLVGGHERARPVLTADLGPRPRGKGVRGLAGLHRLVRDQQGVLGRPQPQREVREDGQRIRLVAWGGHLGGLLVGRSGLVEVAEMLVQLPEGHVGRRSTILGGLRQLLHGLFRLAVLDLLVGLLYGLVELGLRPHGCRDETQDEQGDWHLLHGETPSVEDHEQRAGIIASRRPS